MDLRQNNQSLTEEHILTFIKVFFHNWIAIQEKYNVIISYMF